MHSTQSIIKLIFLLFLGLSISQSVFATTITSTDTATVSAIVGGSISVIPPLNGGGGGILTSIQFSGFAYPKSTVHVWKDGTPKSTATADLNGYFSITLQELYNPNSLYTLYAIDKDNRQSLLLNYPIVIKRGYLTQISGISFAPTVSTDKTVVKEGDYITVSGYALPNAPLDIVVGGMEDKTFYVTSENDGTYKIAIPLLNLPKGNYNLHVNYKNDSRVSKVIQFIIGDANIASIDLTVNIPGDCNADQVINIIDFSVAAFWYEKPNPPRCVDTNNDNIINLVDFSILAFYWTG